MFGALAYFVLIPATLAPDSYWAGVPSFTFYVVLDAYLVVRLLDAISESADRRWRAVYGWFLATCIAWLVLDTTEALLWAEVLPWINAGTPWDLPWMFPLVTLVLVGRPPVPRDEEVEAADDADPRQQDPAPIADRHPGSPLILLAILVPLLHFAVYGLGLFGSRPAAPTS